jgi:DNA gyrase inhibitor GyrI
MRLMVAVCVAVLTVCLLPPLLSTAEKRAGRETTAQEPTIDAETDTSSAEDDAIEVKEMKPFTYCALEMKGSYEQEAAAFQTLFAEAGKQGIALNAVPFGIYWSDPDSAAVEDLEWEIGFAVPAGQKVADPLRKKEWGFDFVASTVYEGSFSEDAMTEVYGNVYRWIDEHGYVPAGPAMEKYPTMPLPDENGELRGTIELVIPIQEAEE